MAGKRGAKGNPSGASDANPSSSDEASSDGGAAGTAGRRRGARQAQPKSRPGRAAKTAGVAKRRETSSRALQDMGDADGAAGGPEESLSEGEVEADAASSSPSEEDSPPPDSKRKRGRPKGSKNKVKKKAKVGSGRPRPRKGGGEEGEEEDEAGSDGEGPSGAEEEAVKCRTCNKAGKGDPMVRCDACAAAFHPRCVGLPPVPRGKKRKRQAYTCTPCTEVLRLQDVDRILAVRKGENGAEEVHVKWRDMSYLHTEWVPIAHFSRAQKMAPGAVTKLKNFRKGKGGDGGSGVTPLMPGGKAGPSGDAESDTDSGSESDAEGLEGVKRSWTVVDRVLARRPREDAEGPEYLVKWKGLGYEECTWEIPEDLTGVESALTFFQSIRAIKPRGAAPKADQGKQKQQGKQQPSKGGAAAEAEGSGAAAAAAPRYSSTPSFFPAGLSLHPYQLEGLNWLIDAWQHQKHVILGDEMGLGKTVQAAAFLSCLEADVSTPGPHLVIAPLSTLENWERELATWCPDMNVVRFQGSQAAREVIKDYEFFELLPDGSPPPKGAQRDGAIKFHVLLASYESVLAEAAFLRGLPWECLIVDEGHRLKSRQSKLFQALDKIRSRHRTLLTGTPIQNSLEELLILLRFLDPDRFGDPEAYLEELGDLEQESQVRRLHEVVAPHLLRRLKKDVLKKLPPKKEVVVRVDLAAAQKRLYRRILEANFPTLAGAAGPGERGSGRTADRVGRMRNVMMQLRKCCNHPFLIEEPPLGGEDLSPEDRRQSHLRQLVAASGKLELLDPLCDQLKARGHRVVLFSQFTRTLDLIEDWVKLRGWGYQRIDGDVAGRDRQQRIDRFNTRPQDYFVFLLSTRAGGLGINLATADTVIIYDSDW